MILNKKTFLAFLFLSLFSAKIFCQNPQLEPNRIEVDLTNQKLYVLKDNLRVFKFLISSGQYLGSTPKGIFRIFSGGKKVKTKPYEATLINYWNFAYSKQGNAIAIHALNYSSYEKKLGRPVSHGCVRVSRKDSGVLYIWVTNFKKNNNQYPQIYIY